MADTVTISRESALDTVIALLTAARAGTLTNDEVAVILDDLLDTGPWDSIDDPAFHGLVDLLVALIPDGRNLWTIFDRDPLLMRVRAQRFESSNPERAARIRARADRVEARQRS